MSLLNLIWGSLPHSFFFFFFLYLFLFFAGVTLNNFIFWWSIFLFTSIGFFFFCSMNLSEGGVLNYFVIQESLGFLFLILKSSGGQWLIIMLKLGVTPFIFWSFYIIENLKTMVLFWFLTFQKLPFIPILINFFMNFYFIFICGISLIYLLVTVVKKTHILVFLSSTESFSWVLLNFIFSTVNFLVLSCFYLYSFFVLSGAQVFVSGGVSLELSLFFLNAPFLPSFFIKFFSVCQSFSMLLIFFLLVVMVVSVLSFFYLFYIFFTKIPSLEEYKLKSSIFYFFFFFFFFFIF